MEKEYLSDWNIVNKGTKTDKVFAKIKTEFSKNSDIPSVYVKKLWDKYNSLSDKDKNNAMNGSIFEAIISTVLIKEGIIPLYTQASLEFVPNINFDIVVFPKNEKGEVDVSAPISLSLKTSLRERYKQADLEGLALKEVYKRATSYLITLESKTEIENFTKKIENKDIRGIDKCVDARTKEFDELIAKIKNNGVAEPPAIKAVKDSKIINKR